MVWKTYYLPDGSPYYSLEPPYSKEEEMWFYKRANAPPRTVLHAQPVVPVAGGPPQETAQQQPEEEDPTSG